MPSCLKCGAELPVNEEGMAPVLCDRCAGRATSRARRGMNAGALLNYPATTLLIAINVGVFLAMPIFGVNPLDPSGRGLVLFGGNYGPYTLGGEYWRLVTTGFVHAGFLHIAMNMLALFFLGRMAERLFGKWQTLCIYLITGVGGALLSLAHEPGHLEVGASGAIFGIAGALIAGLKFGDLPISWREQRGTLSSVAIFTVFSFVWGMRSPDVDNMCHLGGFVSGLLIGLPMGAFASRHKLFQLATVLATSAVIFAAGRELVRTHGDAAQLYRGDTAFRRGDYVSAIPLLEKYTASNPADDEALVELGGAYELTGQRAKAIAAFERALKANPDSDAARDALQTLRGESDPAEK
jgi:membrane associated rhomboid family serine protease